MAFRLPRTISLLCLPLLGLSACAYNDGYGYGGVSVGTGYYGGYDDGFYGPASYYGGWYNDFYYPGTGYYVFDRGGRRFCWDDRQRRYWEARRQQYRGNDGRRDGDRWRGRERRDDWRPRSVEAGRPDAGRPGAGRPGDGRPVDRGQGYNRRPDRAPDASPGQGAPGWDGTRRDSQGRDWQNRNWQGRDRQARDGAGQPRPERPAGQERQWRSESRPAPVTGQGFRREGAGRPERRARPQP